MRTLNANLEAALANGSYNIYVKAFLNMSGVLKWTLNTVIKYRLSEGKRLTLRAQFTYATDDYDQLDTIVLRRGVSIDGTDYYIDTSDFTITKATLDGYYINIEAELLPKARVSTAGDVSYETMLDALATDLGFTTRYIGSYWTNQFLPTGKTFTLNKANGLGTILKQKFFADYTDDGGQQLLFFAAFTSARLGSPDYTITVESLIEHEDNGFVNWGYVGLLYRDENSVVYQPTGANDIFPLYNLGFLKTGDDLPTDSGLVADKLKELPQLITPVIVPMNLTYQTGDKVKILSSISNIFKSGYLKVDEYLDTSKPIAWGLEISLWDYIANTEGGALPSTIERVAAYTPLVSTGFDGNLTPDVNNLQALAQAVDDMDVAPSAKGVTNGDSHDHSGGDGARIISAVQILFTHGLNGQVPASTTQYLMPGPVSGLQAAVSNIQISEAVTASKLYFTTNATQPASGSLVVTVLKNNVATALTITIAASAGAATFSDTTNSVSFAAGDSMTIEVKNNATAASANVTRGSALITY